MTYELRVLGTLDDALAQASWNELSRYAEVSGSGEAPLPPEAKRMVVFRNGKPVARLAFGARTGFTGASGVTGYVGWYAAAEATAGVRILREAASRLTAAGAARVIGPLDGSTWQRYRVTLPSEEGAEEGSPFLSEPRNPPDWAEHFRDAGFRELLEFETRLVRDPAPTPALADRRVALADGGIRIRPLSISDYSAELRALYDLSTEAFSRNPFYSAISFAAFEELYGPLRPLLDPELVRLAEDAEGRLVGYVFAFPDALAPSDHSRIVLKTLAVRADQRGNGLGAVLVDEIHAEAEARGAMVLHALMQVTNASRGISRRSSSEPFRRYVLFGREPE